MSAKSVAFVTLGCAKNEVDTYDMAVKLQQAGYGIVPEPQDAFVVIVNTCAFIQAACEESIAAILEAAELEHIAQGRGVLVLAGCLSSRYGEELEQELPEVHSFVPCKKEDDIVAVVDAAVESLLETSGLAEEVSCGEDLESAACAGLEAAAWGDLEPVVCGDLAPVSPLSNLNPYTAYIKISDGCDKRCSYCMIPTIRGSYHSFTFEQIAHDVQIAIDAGAREIVFIGQDTGIWGYDLAVPRTLAWLLDEFSSAYPSTWFRVMYVQPLGVTDELLSVIARKDNICPYLDMPLQHCEQKVLKAMNRAGSKESLLQTINHIKASVDGIALRTTLMVGFPGETDDDFESLIDFVEQAEFDYVGIFAFSAEEGSPAFDMPQIDEDVKQARLLELKDVADSVSSQVISERVGKCTEVIIEGIAEDGQLFGRSMWQAPEVDGETYVDAGEVGSVVRVNLEGSLFYEMEGSVVEGAVAEDSVAEGTVAEGAFAEGTATEGTVAEGAVHA